MNEIVGFVLVIIKKKIIFQRNKRNLKIMII